MRLMKGAVSRFTRRYPHAALVVASFIVFGIARLVINADVRRASYDIDVSEDATGCSYDGTCRVPLEGPIAGAKAP